MDLTAMRFPGHEPDAYRDHVSREVAVGNTDVLPERDFGRFDRLFAATAMNPGLSAAYEIPPHIASASRWSGSFATLLSG